MEEKKEIKEDPLDLKLQQAITENLQLTKDLKGLQDVAIWIKFFTLFAIIIMVFMLLKVYGAV
jgi:hypothetical protein